MVHLFPYPVSIMSPCTARVRGLPNKLVRGQQTGRGEGTLGRPCRNILPRSPWVRVQLQILNAAISENSIVGEAPEGQMALFAAPGPAGFATNSGQPARPYIPRYYDRAPAEALVPAV